jgi:GTP-binding protein HflX
MQLENGENIVLSDTVGFLHNLPHHLIEAFKATLEELLEADLIIHVLDVSSNRVFQHYKAVQQVLKELGAENKPTVVALNKIDLIEDKMWLEKVQRDFNSGIPISAKLKINLGLLLRKIEEEFGSRMIIIDTLLPINRMDLVNLFYKEGRVDEVKYLQKGIRVKARIPKVLFNKLSHSNEIGNIS